MQEGILNLINYSTWDCDDNQMYQISSLIGHWVRWKIKRKLESRETWDFLGKILFQPKALSFKIFNPVLVSNSILISYSILTGLQLREMLCQCAYSHVYYYYMYILSVMLWEIDRVKEKTKLEIGVLWYSMCVCWIIYFDIVN